MSRKHATMDPDSDKKYWEFSFPELGDFDMPAQVDFVREKTRAKKITYIGHSQGTTQMFYGLSTNCDFWTERINLFVALAPVVDLSNTQSTFIRWFSKTESTLGSLLWFTGKLELFKKGAINYNDSGIC